MSDQNERAAVIAEMEAFIHAEVETAKAELKAEFAREMEALYAELSAAHAEIARLRQRNATAEPDWSARALQ